MTTGPQQVATGQHAERRRTVLLLGRHGGLLESGLEMLAHEGYQAIAVRFEQDPRQALRTTLEQLPPDRGVDVLVLGGAVPAADRPDIRADATDHSPDVRIVEHSGSLNTLFEEVLTALHDEPL